MFKPQLGRSWRCLLLLSKSYLKQKYDWRCQINISSHYLKYIGYISIEVK